MSSANMTLVQSLYDAFGRGDIATIIGALTPDVHWQMHGREQDFPTIGEWRGPERVQEFFRTVAENLEAIEFTPRELHGAADKVFVLGRYRWKVRKTGSPVASDWCHVFTVRNGKVAAFREFTDTATLAAAYRG
jgi:ketosteroid isomerase-like protein